MTAMPEAPAAATADATSVLRVATSTRARARARHRNHVGRLVLLADAAGGALAAGACADLASLRPGRGVVGDRAALAGCLFVAIVGVLAARRSRRGQIAPRVADDIGFITSSLIVAGLLLLAARSLPAVGAAVPPSSIAIAVAAAAVLVPVSREVTIVLAARNPANVARVVVVGSGFIAGYLTARLSRSRLVHVLGSVDDRPGGNQPVLGAFEDLPRLCRALEVDRVVIAFSERHPARTAEVVHAVRPLAEVDVVVRFFEVTGWESRVSDVTGLPVLNLGAPPSQLARAAKRAVDVLVSSAVLGVLGPVLLTVALLVLWESGAPVLFRQERVGRGQRTFSILKFRTMRPADPAEARAAAAQRRTPFDTLPDPARITRLGSILRRTGIDELPQLVNVLRGEMSLVGPRPFIPEECAGLNGTIARRFDVRPGMTGMWQVCGQHELTFEELVRLDLQYATTWSLRGDLRILARTPGRLLRGSAPGR